MADISYPAALGYSRWTAWQAYSSEQSPFSDSAFVPASLLIPIRPQGVLLWRGSFETPVYGARDVRGEAMRVLMESVDQGINTMTIAVPVDQQRIGTLGASLMVQPLRMDPATRGTRGILEGWRIEWVEIP